MPKETEEEKAEKEKVMEAALKNAAEAPLCIMKTIVDTMEMIRVLGEKGSRLAVSDAGVAILFAQAALEGASLNILSIQDDLVLVSLYTNKFFILPFQILHLLM